MIKRNTIAIHYLIIWVSVMSCMTMACCFASVVPHSGSQPDLVTPAQQVERDTAAALSSALVFSFGNSWGSSPFHYSVIGAGYDYFYDNITKVIFENQGESNIKYDFDEKGRLKSVICSNRVYCRSVTGIHYYGSSRVLKEATLKTSDGTVYLYFQHDDHGRLSIIDVENMVFFNQKEMGLKPQYKAGVTAHLYLRYANPNAPLMATDIHEDVNGRRILGYQYTYDFDSHHRISKVAVSGAMKATWTYLYNDKGDLTKSIKHDPVLGKDYTFSFSYEDDGSIRNVLSFSAGQGVYQKLMKDKSRDFSGEYVTYFGHLQVATHRFKAIMLK